MYSRSCSRHRAIDTVVMFQAHPSGTKYACNGHRVCDCQHPRLTGDTLTSFVDTFADSVATVYIRGTNECSGMPAGVQVCAYSLLV